MNSIDSAQFLVAEISKSLANVNDTLALVGLFYIGKLSVKCISNSFCGFKTYILPRLISNDKWLKSLGNWAIVTGCTHGIGLAYAKELAKRGINLILIARNEELLQKVSKVLEEKHKIKTKYICVDLSDTNSYEKIEKVVLAKDIGILINNVGISHEASFFHLIPTDMIEKVINVNIKTLTMITRMVLPDMVKKNKGAIVNVSSAVVYMPGNLFSVYASSKAYIDKFTETLRYEYRKTNIVFQCVNPAQVYTNMSSRSIGSKTRTIKLTAVQYASFALRTLGYSNHTFGHWLHGIQFLVCNLIPKFLFYPFYINTIEKILLKSREEHYASHSHGYEDIDMILNSD